MGRKRQKLSQRKTRHPRRWIGLSPERILSILALIISALSVFFAWRSNLISQEANQIAMSQVLDDLIIANVSFYGSNQIPIQTPVYTEENIEVAQYERTYIYCSHKLRLVNNGGSPSSILDFSVEATWDDEIALLRGYGEAVAWPPSQNPFKRLPLEMVKSVMVTEDAVGQLPLDSSWIDNDEQAIQLPLSIDAHSATDFVVHTIIALLPHDNVLAISGYFDADKRGPRTNPNTAYPTFALRYSFWTSSGNQVSSSPAACWKMELFPAGTEIKISPESSGE